MTTATAIDNAVANIVQAQSEDTNEVVERAPHVGILWRCLVARVHPFFPGPPGVAKSMMLRLIKQHLAGDPEFKDEHYFEQQVFADTKTEVLFGPYSMRELDNDRYVRVATERIPEALLAFVDELFDASAGTLNTLRPVLAEGLFYNPKPQPIPLMMLAAAGNHYPAPDREDLQALLDRFGVIKPVRPIQSAAGFRAMLVGQFARRRSGPKGDPTTVTLAELRAVQQAVDDIRETDEYLDANEQLWQACEDEGLTNISGRRWGEIGRLAATDAVFAGRDYLIAEDLRVAQDCLWKQPNDEKLAYELTQPFMSAFEQNVGRLRDNYEEQAEVVRNLRKQVAEKTQEPDFHSVGGNTNVYLKKVKDEAVKALQEGTDQGRDTRELAETIERIQDDRRWLLKNVLGLEVEPD
jgi:MoxR-like ATPase